MADNNELALEIPKQNEIISIDVRCGDCFHFNNQRAPTFNDICKNIGILKIGRPCSSFLVNAHVFDIKAQEGRDLREFVGQLPSQKLALFSALLMQEKRTRRYGFRHGEMVYIRMFPEDYLSNYFRAWVIMADRRRIFVQGTDKNFRGVFVPSSVLDAVDFLEHKKKLIERKALVDPNLRKYTEWRPKSKVNIDYEPAVINGVLNDRSVIKKRKKLRGKRNSNDRKEIKQYNMRG